MAIRFRQGLHATSARDIEAFVDFFDFAFGRITLEPPRTLFYDFSFEKWMRLSGERIQPDEFPEKNIHDVLMNKQGAIISSLTDWTYKKTAIREQIAWGLGDEPPYGKDPGPKTMAKCDVRGDDYLGEVIGRPQATAGMGRLVIHPYDSFGDYLYANLYYPIDKNGKAKSNNLPVIIYLHQYSHASGFAKTTREFFESLVDKGFAVFAFDMIGFGTRVMEGTRFYERYPRWSKMGRMIADVRSAVDALENFEIIDKRRIYVFGYTLGGTVGHYAAALDDRIVGAASVCGVTPMRIDARENGIEGVKAYSHLHGLLPRLGFFIGSERRIPYDFHEILACIAPRPVLVVAPQLDRDAPFVEVKRYADEAAKVYQLYDAQDKFTFSGPRDYNRFFPDRQRQVVDWFSSIFDID